MMEKLKEPTKLTGDGRWWWRETGSAAVTQFAEPLVWLTSQIPRLQGVVTTNHNVIDDSFDVVVDDVIAAKFLNDGARGRDQFGTSDSCGRIVRKRQTSTFTKKEVFRWFESRNIDLRSTREYECQWVLEVSIVCRSTQRRSDVKGLTMTVVSLHSEWSW